MACGGQTLVSCYKIKGKELFHEYKVQVRLREIILSNEKYTEDVKLLKLGKSEIYYLASGNNPTIISKEVFEAMQPQKAWRSNVMRDENGSKRKSEKYSSKKKYN